MKNPPLLPRLSTLLLLLASLAGRAQSSRSLEATAHSRQAFTLPPAAGRRTLAVYNVNGAVTVQGYAGNQVLVEATKIIRADNDHDLATGQREARLGFAQRGDSLVVYLAAPFDSRPRHQGEKHGQPAYHYVFELLVKVPYQLALHVATINEGAVRVLDVTGPLEVNNVNGAIALTNVRGTTQAHTVNGNVDATYAAAPTGASSYRTINGQIRVHYPASLSATAHFKSLHGELYTDFAEARPLPLRASQNRQGQGNGTVYHLAKETAVRFGAGGPDLHFKTLNGDVTISRR